MNTEIDMYNRNPSFEGLSFVVDTMSNKKGLYHVMPIFYEEQPITWDLYSEEITNFIHNHKYRSCGLNVLDVGCGSGFWAMLLKSKFPDINVTAIDKNGHAIDIARNNCNNNNLEINFVNDVYSAKSFKANKFDLIILSPPYHLYPNEIESSIPLFSRGGSDGLFELYSQLTATYIHLNEGGLILFNHMCVGDINHPAYVNKVKDLFKTGLLEYTNILPPIGLSVFLTKLYDHTLEQYYSYISFITKKYTTLYYTSGIYKKNREAFECLDNSQSKKGILSSLSQTWEDRIKLHSEINKFDK